MPIANYTTQVNASKSVQEIMDMLRTHHAKSVMIDWDSLGQPVGVAFLISTKHGDVAFRLPANIEACKLVLKRQAVRAFIDQERASRVAWRILRDWVRAQMAILETEMVSIEEIFLPYMKVKDKTLFQVMEERQYLLTSGKETE